MGHTCFVGHRCFVAHSCGVARRCFVAIDKRDYHFGLPSAESDDSCYGEDMAENICPIEVDSLGYLELEGKEKELFDPWLPEPE